LGELVSANCTAALAFHDHEDAFEILRALKAEKHIIAACLYDKNGKIFAKYPSYLPQEALPAHPETDGYKYVNGYLQGFQPVTEKKERVGTLYLQSDMGAINDRFIRYGLIVLLVVSISFIVAYLLSKKLQKTISEPILALAKTAGNISYDKDYTVRAKKFDNDELGVLTDAFNQMLEQIQRQNEEITQFNHALEVKVNERTAQLEQANNELTLKNEFVETIIDSSVDVIAVFDTDLNYVVMNRYGLKLYGIENSVIGRNMLDMFPHLKGGQMHADLVKSLQGETIHNPYYKSRISNRILENFYIPLKDKDHNVYRVLVIGHDITETVEANQKLTSLNIELEQSNNELEQFAYIASHDLQEPLRKIQTFSQLVQKRIDDKEVTKNYISKIYSSAARMTEMIKAILNYSRLSSEKAPFVEVDLNLIVENIKTDLELAIAEKEATISVSQLPAVSGNPLQLHQLFFNLISNSLKFSRRKPVITISANIVGNNTQNGEVNMQANNKYAELVFKDNGIGFEQHHANKIFNVFQRLHNREEFAGTGIGLALCKKIIENHHGTISANSVPDEGTSFIVRLPI
ncbi:MAG TPA: ATP-binding protein, partial [Segetibacter sp.]